MLLTDQEGRARWRWVQPTETPHQPGAKRRDERYAKRRDERCAKRLRLGVLLGLGLPVVLGGCSDVPDRINPVTWWHHMEGGEIAQYRPPPPNPTAPFPKIGNQPTRPAGMPDWEWNQLSATLAEQRSAAQTYAAQNPIPTLPQTAPQPSAAARKPAPVKPVPIPSAPPAVAAAPAANDAQSAATAAEIARLAAAPGPAGSQTPPPSAAAVATATANAGNSNTSSLTFQGPNTPPPASGPQSVPISQTAAGAPNPGGPAAGTKVSYFDPSNGLSIPGALSPVEQPDEAHPPPVPASIPVPPAVPGFAISTVPATYVAPVPLPEPAAYVPPAPLPAVGPVPIQFAPHSAVLTPPMQKALVNLTIASKGANVAVTGFGDAHSTSIGDQAAAMPLALERARAMMVQLMADGFPAQGITVGARALGSGGLAQLVN
jgi:outer membrane protein OmpA-like peptidoglycan-associated protein